MKNRALYNIVPGGILILAGFLNSVYLSISHYRVYTDIGYSSFCAISKAINCDTVSQSSYSILLGLPVPIWGVIGYSLLIFLFPFLFQKKNTGNRLWALFFLLVSFFSAYCLILGLISSFYIHSYCLMCLVFYAINFALNLYAYIGIKQLKGGIWKGLAKDVSYLNAPVLRLLLILFSVFVVGIWIVFPQYWIFETNKDLLKPESGITRDGSHWIGAKEPEVTIIEYTDYLCFQCKKMHFYLRSIVAENPYKIRLVHKHFPLDKEFNFAIEDDLHPGSGKMAMLAIYAGMKKRFWEMNDHLFQIDHSKGSIDLTELAEKTQIKPEELAWALDQKPIRLMLKKDIAFGAKAGVTGTPSYIINGNLYLGTIPSDILAEVK